MTQRRISFIVLGATVVLGVSALVGWWAWNDGRKAWWATASAWELAPEQADLIQECGDPSWLSMLRVLHQDLSVTCEPSWFANAAQPHLEGVGHRARLRWLREVYSDPTVSHRARFRAGQSLIIKGETAPGFALLSREPDLRDARLELAHMIGRGDLSASPWADPELVADAALTQLDVDSNQPVAASMLRHEALFSQGDADRRTRMAEAALEQANLSAGVLQSLLERRAAGMPLHQLSPDLAVRVINHGSACRELASAPCLSFAADMLEATSEAPSAPPNPHSPPGLGELWSVLDAHRPHATPVRRTWFQHLVQWVQSADQEERATRIIGMVTGGPDVGNDIRLGQAGDPSTVLRRRSDGPWMTALVAMALGLDSDVPVYVSLLDTQVGIDVDGVRVTVDTCGLAQAVPAEQQWPAAWPLRAVLAQATAESAQAALRRSDPHTAHRLLSVASRWDPLGVDALLGLPDHVGTPDDHLGTAVAGALGAPVGSPISTHTDERRAMADLRNTTDPAAQCGVSK
ncbi:MAG: hypothetical protein ACI9MC_001846 [Kiritimatiellia bacterium]|jgi:hypothetical protein